MKIKSTSCFENIFLKNKGIIKQNISFEGSPHKIYNIDVKNYQDALQWWEKLRYAKYLDAHQNSYYDKAIRTENYSFLDKLHTSSDKSSFIEKFCEFTEFPNLRNISDKIDSTFKACINKVSQHLNSSNYTSEYNIIDYGYDPTCSLGLRKAFPGSDLDKGYVILEGSRHLSSDADRQIVNNFQGKMWEELDQRIVSLNHPETALSVYTKQQVTDTLDNLDKIVNTIISDANFKLSLGTFAVLTAASLLGPLAIISGSAVAGLFLGKVARQETSINPYETAKFNRQVASKIDNSKERENAKNFAFFIEIVLANLKKNLNEKPDLFFSRIKNSPFAENSNVTQVKAWQYKIDNGYMKSKLKNRIKLESDFSSMSTNTKYDLIKDVIKYGTDDQSSKFSEYFKNDDDIANRYDELLRSLK